MPDRRIGAGGRRRQPDPEPPDGRSAQPGAPGQVELDRATPAGQAFADERDHRVTLVGADLEERHTGLVQQLGKPLHEPADDRQTIRPAVQRDDRLVAGGAGQLRQGLAADVRQVGEHDLEGMTPAGSRSAIRTGSGPPPRDRRRSRPPARAPRTRCRSRGCRPHRVRADAGARPPGRPRSRHSLSHVRDPQRRPVRRTCNGAQSAHDLGLCQLDEPLRLRPRDQRPAVHLEREPVELLEPTQVGDRLAGSAALDVGSIPACGVCADRRLGMRQHDRSTDTDRMAQQQLGVEPRRLGAGVRETVGSLTEERSGRLARKPSRWRRRRGRFVGPRSFVSQRRRPRPGGPPGRPSPARR